MARGDEGIRARERRVALDRSPAEVAALLVDQMRLGRLERDRVELAAYMGHPGAMRALEEGAPNYGHVKGLGPGACLPAGCCWRCGWVNSSYGVIGLARWGPETLVRAAVAAARCVLPLWEQSADGSGPDASHCNAHDDQPDSAPWPQSVLDCPICTEHAPRLAIAAAESWLDCPCHQHLVAWTNTFRVDLPRWAPTSATTITRSPPTAGVAEAQRLAGHDAVRDAIRVVLVAWALPEWAR